MREHAGYVNITRTLADGNVLRIALTSATTAYVQAEGKFLYRDARYYATAHLCMVAGEWLPGDSAGSNGVNIPSAPSLNLSPKSVYGYIRKALVDDVNTFLKDADRVGQRYRADAEIGACNNDIMRAEEDRADLVKKLAALDAFITGRTTAEALAKEGVVPSTYVYTPRPQ